MMTGFSVTHFATSLTLVACFAGVVSSSTERVIDDTVSRSLASASHSLMDRLQVIGIDLGTTYSCVAVRSAWE